MFISSFTQTEVLVIRTYLFLAPADKQINQAATRQKDSHHRQIKHSTSSSLFLLNYYSKFLMKVPLELLLAH